MNKRLQFATALLATLGSWSLYGQDMRLRTQIPFTFRVGEKVMPAGVYLIHNSANMLVLTEQSGGRTTAIVITGAAESGVESNKAELLFNQYGDEYFLEKISVPYSTVAREILQTRRERELARRFGPAQNITVAAKTQ